MIMKLAVSNQILDILPDEVPVPGSDLKDASDIDLAVELMAATTQFKEALNKCAAEISLPIKILNNKFIIANTEKETFNKLTAATENLEVSTEDMQPLFMRIIKSIIEFIKHAWRWFFGFSTSTTRYFSNNLKVVDQIEEWVKKFEGRVTTMGIDAVVNLKGLSAERMTWKTKKNNTITLDEFSQLFDALDLYIDQPERNNTNVINDMENNRSAMHEILGITIIPNKNELLAESRIVTIPLEEMYDTKTDRLDKMDHFDIAISQHWTTLRMDLAKIKGILSDGIKLGRMFENIKKSYDDVEKTLNSITAETPYVDATAAAARTKSLIIAKEHIRKSQILLDRFIQILHIEVVQYVKLFTLAKKYCKIHIA